MVLVTTAIDTKERYQMECYVTNESLISINCVFNRKSLTTRTCKTVWMFGKLVVLIHHTIKEYGGGG